jgi:hypothetical protein
MTEKTKEILVAEITTEYYGVPAWFARQLNDDRGALFNVKDCKHYVGHGFDRKKHVWRWGSFYTDFFYSLLEPEKDIQDTDFIIHFDRGYKAASLAAC